jgi:hypothetical protein
VSSIQLHNNRLNAKHGSVVNGILGRPMGLLGAEKANLNVLKVGQGWHM